MAARSTASLFGDMLGLNNLTEAFKAISDPNNVAQAMSTLHSLKRSFEAQERIEAKLNLILRERGIDVAEFDRRFAEFQSSRRSDGGPVLLEQQRAAGAGGHSATGGAVDHGSEAAAEHHSAGRTGGPGR